MPGSPSHDATLVSHLEALRSAILRSFAILGVGIVPLFLASPYVLDWFCKQVSLQTGLTLHYFSPLEVFLLQLKIAALLTPPDIISQLLLGTPTYLLFEAGLLAARRYKK